MTHTNSKFLTFLKKSWKEGTQIGKANIMTAALIGGPAHIFLYFFNTYVIPLPYESFALRATITIICISTYFYPYLPKKIKDTYFPFYWHFMITASLTFNATFFMLKNHFDETYLYWEIFVTFLLAIYVPHWFIFTIDLILSMSVAVLLYIYTTPIIDLKPNFNVFGYLIVLSFTALSGVVFVHGNRAAWLSRQKKQYKRLTSIAGSIVHEIRNPLNSINLVDSEIKELLKNPKTITQEKLVSFEKTLSRSIKQANEIIDIALSDLSNKTVDKEDFKYLNLNNVNNIVSEYGYNKQELNKVKLEIDDKNQFYFKAIPERLTFIVYNLIKNSLFYINEYPESLITIGSEKNKKFKDKQNLYNVIYVYDTGPGIPGKSLNKIFDSFYTQGKKGGTGLGLDFCKRTMTSFGGDIICESQYGNGKSGWTKFSLLFPILSTEELKEADEIFNNIKNNSTSKDNIDYINLQQSKFKILLVDDQETNLIITKQKITSALSNVSCDLALGGEEAIDLLKKDKNNEYKIVLLDIQMPELSGMETIKELRKFNENIPVIALTSLNHREFVAAADNDQTVINSFNLYLNKSVPANIIYRSITKLTAQKDDLEYLGDEEEYAKYLNNKSIILADDQETNLMITKRKFEQYGLKVDTVTNGEELVQLYRDSLDDNYKSKYDMIVTDINMPLLNGDEAAKQIKEIELQNNTYYRNTMPIIALSGDGDEDDINHFMDYRITDYFIKGNDPQVLIRIMANYLVQLNENQYGSDFNRGMIDSIENSVNEQRRKTKKIIEEKPKKENNGDNNILNINFLNQISNDDVECKKSILKSFLKDSEAVFDKLENNSKSSDIKNLYLDCHALKGISSNIGANELFHISSTICYELKNGQMPTDSKWYEKLSKSYESVVKAVQKEMS